MGQGSLELLDYRRQVSAHYLALRQQTNPPSDRWQRWRERRDKLFRDHPQSPLKADDRKNFTGLSYFKYYPAMRLEVAVEPVKAEAGLAVELKADGLLSLERLGLVYFEIKGFPAALTVYWLGGYGGGIFLPFRDSTNGKETYGGGRYLLDTIKGADLGGSGKSLVLDFNFAYNPSCAYNPRWHCPLAPPENWLEIAVEAGEMNFDSKEMVEPDASAIPH